MDTRLNFFFPYESAAASHENQLTRALLVVLRYSPMAHQVWLRMVAPEHSLQNLPNAEFATQRQRVFDEGVNAGDGDAVVGISVWLAPDAKQITKPMTPSDRLQVLDGIIRYGDSLVVVIENKISFAGVTEQPHRINLHGAIVAWNETPRSVDWQTLLASFSDLVERSLVSGAEQILIGDFLYLVESAFPLIGPYFTLARCGNQAFRLNRRLDAVLGEVTRSTDDRRLGCRDITGAGKIAMAQLELDEPKSLICLRLYPGDTLGQSRELYGDNAAIHSVLALRSAGWQVEPHFHWGFMTTGYAWTDSPCGTDAYCDYWVKRIGATGELRREEWNAYWAELESAGIVEAIGKEKFDTHFTNTQRKKAQPRPALACVFPWTLAEARQLDSRREFIGTVRARLNQLLGALSAPPM
jgi:hypothetical protein